MKPPARADAGFLRPGALERGFGRALALLVRLGLVRGHFQVLEVAAVHELPAATRAPVLKAYLDRFAREGIVRFVSTIGQPHRAYKSAIRSFLTLL